MGGIFSDKIIFLTKSCLHIKRVRNMKHRARGIETGIRSFRRSGIDDRASRIFCKHRPHRARVFILLLSISLFLTGENIFAQTAPDTVVAGEYFATAEDLARQAHYDSSNVYYEKSAKIYERAALRENDAGLWEKHIRCYNGLGVNFRRQGFYGLSLTYLNQALRVGLDKLGSQSLTVAACYQGIGVVYSVEGEFAKALEFYHKSLQIKRQAAGEEHRSVAISYNSIGNVYRAKGDYERALEYYHKALGIAIKISGSEDPAVAAFYFNIGVACYDRGDYERALEYFLKSLSIELQTLGEEHPSIAAGYNNIANVYHDKGDTGKALEYHRKALALRLRTLGEEHTDVAESYFNLARSYAAQGDYSGALEYHHKALSIERKAVGEEHYWIAESYFQIGNVYFAEGSFDSALEYYHKALALQHRTLGERHPEVALTHQQIGKVYQERGDTRQALAYYHKTFTILVPGFNDKDIRVNPPLENCTHPRYLLSSLVLKAGALEELSRQPSGGPASPAGRGETGLIQLSLTTWKLASRLTDEIRRAYQSEGSKLLLSRETAGIYRKGIQTASKLYNISGERRYSEEIFQLMEQGKAAVLQEALQESQARQFAGIPDSLLERERELRINLAYYRTQIEKESEMKEAGQDAGKLSGFQKRLFALNREYEQLTARFESEFPQYYNLKYRTRIASIAELQSVLGQRSAILSYFIGDGAIYIAAITGDAFNVSAAPIDSTFGETVETFYKSLKTVDKEDYLRSAAVLYQKLLQPVEKYLAGKKRLIIIPGDILYYVPFEALLAGDSSRSGTVDFTGLDYLVRRYEISYHYSATLFLEQQRSAAALRQPVSGFIGFAPVFADKNRGINSWLADVSGYIESLLDYRSITVDGRHFKELKYSEEEVKDIAGMFRNRNAGAAGYFHGQASEENFKDNAGRYRYIHVATHGLLNEENPALSGLIFSGAQGSPAVEDGILYSAETYNLDLNADLVVLSSCESGIGKLVKGEGLMALTRGFLYSGAKNVIHSLWKVSDKETRRLMAELYRNILHPCEKYPCEGSQPSQGYSAALRAAKLSLIAKETTAFPASWSSFVLVGN